MLNVSGLTRIGLLLIEVTFNRNDFLCCMICTIPVIKPRKTHKLCLSGPPTEPFYHETLMGYTYTSNFGISQQKHK